MKEQEQKMKLPKLDDLFTIQEQILLIEISIQ